MPRSFRRASIAVLALIAAAPALAAGGSAPNISAYGGYAQAVRDECVRNRAYGLDTRGIPLVYFCEQMGNEAALREKERVRKDRQRGQPQQPQLGVLPVPVY